MLLKSSLVSLIVFLSTTEAFTIKPDLPEVNGNIFYYFGFGSNMLTQRIHIQNPTAVKIGVGQLKEYRLDFNTYSSRWDGAPATMVPTLNGIVYGTVWEIDLSNLDDIDDQEGVPEGLYYPVSLPIILANSTEIIARAYLLTDQPKSELSSFPFESVPEERQPSKTYLQCLVKGAVETGIPNWYISWLKSIEHNGRVAKELEDLLQLKDVEVFN